MLSADVSDNFFSTADGVVYSSTSAGLALAKPTDFTY